MSAARALPLGKGELGWKALTTGATPNALGAFLPFLLQVENPEVLGEKGESEGIELLFRAISLYKVLPSGIVFLMYPTSARCAMSRYKPPCYKSRLIL